MVGQGAQCIELVGLFQALSFGLRRCLLEAARELLEIRVWRDGLGSACLTVLPFRNACLVDTRMNKFLYVHPAVAEALGYNPADMVGQSTFEFVVPEDRARLLEEVEFRQITGMCRPFDLRIQHRLGHTVYLSLAGEILEASAGRIVVGTITRFSFDMPVRCWQVPGFVEIGQKARPTSDLWL